MGVVVYRLQQYYRGCGIPSSACTQRETMSPFDLVAVNVTLFDS